MRLFVYESKRFRPIVLIAVSGLFVLMLFSTQYEIGLQTAIDQIVILIIALLTLVATIWMFVHQYETQRLLYVNAHVPTMRRVHLFLMVVVTHVMVVLIVGMLILNMKAIYLSMSDWVLYHQRGVDRIDFVLIHRFWYEILVIVLNLFVNVLFFSMVSVYAVYVAYDRLTYERIYPKRQTIMRVIIMIVFIQGVYRMLIHVMSKPFWRLDFNLVSYWSIMRLPDTGVLINLLFVPALIIVLLEGWRMDRHLRIMLEGKVL